MRRFAMAALALLMAGPAAATSLWEGTVGKAPVVVQWDPSKDTGGTYFYRRHLRDIGLETSTVDGQPTAQEQILGEYDKPSAQWRMQAPGATQWSGQWQGVDGKRLPIRLKAVVADTPADAGLKAMQAQDAYKYQRLKALRLEATKQETRPGGFHLQWWREPRSGIELFEVTAGYPDDARARINARLRQRLWQEVDGYFGCMSSANTDFNQSVTLRYLTADAVSVSVFTDYYCGGAHPDFGDNPLNLDARTGEVLQLEDIVYVGQGTPPRYREDQGSDAGFRPWADYRGGVFAPWLVEVFTALYPDEMKPAASDDDCAYDDPEVWKFPNWYLTDQGVYLGPSFARVARACEYPEFPVLPWAQVRKHAGRVRVGPR